jgi:hypothetical protein
MGVCSHSLLISSAGCGQAEQAGTSRSLGRSFLAERRFKRHYSRAVPSGPRAAGLVSRSACRSIWYPQAHDHAVRGEGSRAPGLHPRRDPRRPGGGRRRVHRREWGRGRSAGEALNAVQLVAPNVFTQPVSAAQASRAGRGGLGGVASKPVLMGSLPSRLGHSPGPLFCMQMAHSRPKSR